MPRELSQRRPRPHPVLIVRSSDRRAVSALLDRRPARNADVERSVARIVAGVRRLGDRALLDYARRFDRLTGKIEVSAAEMRQAGRSLDPRTRRAIREAAANIRRVAARQVPKPWSMSPVPGVTITQRVVPLDSVGCYVPGGRYPLPSSLLMTAIPAVAAGVKQVIAVCPRPDASVMFAASEAGVTRLLRIGGAHAVAALAYGTATVPRVDKIVGPGNAYVAAAKALVAADCAIDFFAGPSEIAVVSVSGDPRWIAADLAPAVQTAYYTGMSEELFIEKDINWLRLRDLTFRYSLPEGAFLNTRTASVYVTMTDLFLITNYSGLDPIVNGNSAAVGGSGGAGIDYGNFPMPKSINVGFKVGF